MAIDKRIPPENIRSWVGPFRSAKLFVEIGEQTANLLKTHAGLLPSHTMLDAGCGCGRVALRLLDYFKGYGEYSGFDICPEHISWCAENILPSYKNFHFIHLDIRKKLYNPSGKLRLKETALPYPERKFDIICAHSLFTHMIDDEMEHYIAEFTRVIKKGGVFYASYYLINNKTEQGIRKRTARFNFIYPVRECYTFDRVNPEEGIAQKESFVRRIYKKHGFQIIEPVHFSGWDVNRRPDQDFIIARFGNS